METAGKCASQRRRSAGGRTRRWSLFLPRRSASRRPRFGWRPVKPTAGRSSRSTASARRKPSGGSTPPPDANRLDPAEIVLQERDEEVEDEPSRDRVQERMDAPPLALSYANERVGDEPEPDAVRDRERERHDQNGDRRREAEREIAEIDSGQFSLGDPVLSRLGSLLRLGERGHHQVADDDERRRSRLQGHHADEWGEEHEREEQRAANDRNPTGAATGSDSRSRLDVRRRRGGGRRAAGHRRDGVDEKGLADLGELTVLRQVARLLPHPDKGPHRVEEVGEEEGEDPRQRRHNPERRERVEADVADQAEVRTVDDVAGPASDPGCRERLVVGPPVDQGRQDRRGDNADQQVAAEAPSAERERDRQAEERDQDRPRREAGQGDRNALPLDDETGVVEADEGDEEADADRDRLLQLERDRTHGSSPAYRRTRGSSRARPP